MDLINKLLIAFALFLLGCNPSAKKEASTDSDQIKVLLEKIQKAPSYNNYISLGLAYAKDANHKEAVVAYEKAIEINPEAPLAWNNLCVAYNNLKDFSKAISHCENAIRIEPLFQLAKNNLKYAKEQIKINKVKSTQNTESSNTLLQLGMSLYSQGQHSKAISEWKKIKPQDKEFATAQNNIASSLILTKKYQQAKVFLDKALALQPKNKLFLANKKWLESEVKK